MVKFSGNDITFQLLILHGVNYFKIIRDMMFNFTTHQKKKKKLHNPPGVVCTDSYNFGYDKKSHTNISLFPHIKIHNKQECISNFGTVCQTNTDYIMCVLRILYQLNVHSENSLLFYLTRTKEKIE